MKILKKGFRSVIRRQIVSNKADGRISKRWLQENKTPTFPRKRRFFTPSDVRVMYADVRVRIRGLEMFIFRKM